MSDDARGPAEWAGGRGRGFAGGRFRSPVGNREERVIRQAAAPADTEAAPAGVDVVSVPEDAAPQSPAAGEPAAPGTGLRGAAERAGVITAEWAPVAGRVLLGLVLAWFGYHELTQPGLWTGYVPFVNEASNLAIVAVLVHGWILFVLAVALVAGVAPRVSAAIASQITQKTMAPGQASASRSPI